MDKNKALRVEVVRRVLAVSAVFLLGAGTANACSPNIEPAQIEQANTYLEQNMPRKAVASMYLLIQQGSGGAYRYLSEMFEQGRGVKKSLYLQRHLNWLGALEGDPGAMYRTAVDFSDLGHLKDSEYWAKRSMDCGNDDALVFLLQKYIKSGRDEEAALLLRKGAEGATPKIKIIIAEQYEKGGLGLPQDRKEAFAWYYSASLDGLNEAMAAVAYYFFHGLHGVQDDVAAIHWYHKASRAGHVGSIAAYGWMLEKGRGAQKDVEEAKRMYHLASDKGYEEAKRLLASMNK